MSNENLENKTYPDWDNVIVQLCQGEKELLTSKCNVKIWKQFKHYMEVKELKLLK